MAVVRHDLSDLYDGSYRRLVAQVFSLTLDLAAAHDAVGEAFARATARRRSSFWRSDDPEGWLRAVALSVARRRGRRQAVLGRLLTGRELPGRGSPERSAQPVQHLPALSPTHLATLDALRRLPARLREPVALHHLAGLSVGQVAALLDHADGTVQARLEQGRQVLGDHSLEGLLVAVGDAVEQPPRAGVEQRAERLRRRRLGTAATALAALVTVALTGPVRRSGPEPTPDPVPTPGALFEVRQVAFTSPSTGYVLLGSCTVGSCHPQPFLARTTDSGRSWQRLDSPLDALVTDDGVSVRAVGEQVALVTRNARHVSRDAGRHWQSVPADQVGSPTRRRQPGQTLTSFCAGIGCEPTLTSFDVIEGVHHPLTTQPTVPNAVAVNNRSAASSGLPPPPGSRLWIMGTSGGRGALTHLAHSDDDGRSWRQIPLPTRLDGNEIRPRFLTHHSTERGYLVILSDPVRAWRLDSPADPQWVSLESTFDALRAPVRTIWPLPNGELRIADVLNQIWHTEDRGTRFVPAPKTEVDGARINVTVHQVVDAVLIGTPVSGRRGDRVLFSTDMGQTWQVRPVRF